MSAPEIKRPVRVDQPNIFEAERHVHEQRYVVRDCSGAVIAYVHERSEAELIAAALNAAPRCGCHQRLIEIARQHETTGLGHNDAIRAVALRRVAAQLPAPAADPGEVEALKAQNAKLLDGALERVALDTQLHDALTAAGVPVADGIVMLGLLTRAERLASDLANWKATAIDRAKQRDEQEGRRLDERDQWRAEKEKLAAELEQVKQQLRANATGAQWACAELSRLSRGNEWLTAALSDANERIEQLRAERDSFGESAVWKNEECKRLTAELEQARQQLDTIQAATRQQCAENLRQLSTAMKQARSEGEILTVGGVICRLEQLADSVAGEGKP